MELLSINGSILPTVTLIGEDTALKPHRNITRVSNDYIFYIITDGEIFFNEDGIEYHLKKGDCFLFEPGKHHFGTKDSCYNLIYIHFRHKNSEWLTMSDDDFAEKLCYENGQWIKCAENGPYISNSIVLPKKICFSDSSAFRNICLLAQRAIEKRQIHLEGFNLLCACGVIELFCEIYRNTVQSVLKSNRRGGSGIYRINEVIAFLNANYTRKLTGDIIEKEFSYNFDYLNQLFKRYLDTSIFKMLERIRIEAAKSLLLTTNHSIEEVSEKVGYSDETYFSKVFKKYTGCSPSKYRKKP